MQSIPAQIVKINAKTIRIHTKLKVTLPYRSKEWQWVERNVRAENLHPRLVPSCILEEDRPWDYMPDSSVDCVER
jgi:hypothetical protein